MTWLELVFLEGLVSGMFGISLTKHREIRLIVSRYTYLWLSLQIWFISTTRLDNGSDSAVVYQIKAPPAFQQQAAANCESDGEQETDEELSTQNSVPAGNL